MKNLTAVFLYNLILLNTMALSESRFETRNTKIGEKTEKVPQPGLHFLYLFDENFTKQNVDCVSSESKTVFSTSKMRI